MYLFTLLKFIVYFPWFLVSRPHPWQIRRMCLLHCHRARCGSVPCHFLWGWSGAMRVSERLRPQQNSKTQWLCIEQLGCFMTIARLSHGFGSLVAAKLEWRLATLWPGSTSEAEFGVVLKMLCLRFSKVCAEHKKQLIDRSVTTEVKFLAFFLVFLLWVAWR